MHASWNQRKQSKRPNRRRSPSEAGQRKRWKKEEATSGNALLSLTMQTDMYDMISSHFHHLALKQETADINFFTAVYTTRNFMIHEHSLYVPRLLHIIQLSGYSISSGRTLSSNSSGVKNPRATVASFNVVPSLCAFFAHLATSTILAVKTN
jgi:hypothetical protein